MVASASVTAGFKCPPLMLPTQYTPTVTASAQPVVMTIQPEFWPLDLLRRTLATTPSPRRTRMAVPKSSARKGDMTGSRLFVWER